MFSRLLSSHISSRSRPVSPQTVDMSRPEGPIGDGWAEIDDDGNSICSRSTVYMDEDEDLFYFDSSTLNNSYYTASTSFSSSASDASDIKVPGDDAIAIAIAEATAPVLDTAPSLATPAVVDVPTATTHCNCTTLESAARMLAQTRIAEPASEVVNQEFRNVLRAPVKIPVAFDPWSIENLLEACPEWHDEVSGMLSQFNEFRSAIISNNHNKYQFGFVCRAANPNRHRGPCATFKLYKGDFEAFHRDLLPKAWTIARAVGTRRKNGLIDSIRRSCAHRVACSACLNRLAEDSHLAWKVVIGARRERNRAAARS